MLFRIDDLLALPSIELYALVLHNPIAEGNKWFKMKYNLIEAQQFSHHTLLTFGGAYSNHILATASAGRFFGLQTIGVIRGEEYTPMNEVLTKAQHYGMKFHYLDRTTYRQKNEPLVLSALEEKFGRFYLLPEGGSNHWAVKGCAEIPDLIDFPCDYIATAAGTGGTTAGLIASGTKATILSFSVLKGGDFLRNDIEKLLQTYENHFQVSSKRSHWQLFTEYHFGGYAKSLPEMNQFVRFFEEKTSIKIEPIYTAKMIQGVVDLIQKGFFAPKSKIVLLITCGKL